jgi:hypothetical protein
MGKQRVLIALSREQLPERLQALSEPELELLQVVCGWGMVFTRGLPEMANTLDVLAAGLRELQGLCEREQRPDAVADRLMREVA